MLITVTAGAVIDPTTFGNAVIDELNRRGVKGYAQVIASQGGITAETDVTGLSVTWTAIASRYYRTSFYANLFSTAADDNVIVKITDGAAAMRARGSVITRLASFGIVCQGEVIESGLSGSITRKLRALRNSGSGTVTVEATGTYPAFIIVEDIGPV